MKCFAKTDLGKARELNEDSYYIPAEENELRIYMLADEWEDIMEEKLQVNLQ